MLASRSPRRRPYPSPELETPSQADAFALLQAAYPRLDRLKGLSNVDAWVRLAKTGVITDDMVDPGDELSEEDRVTSGLTGISPELLRLSEGLFLHGTSTNFSGGAFDEAVTVVSLPGPTKEAPRALFAVSMSVLNLCNVGCWRAPLQISC